MTTIDPAEAVHIAKGLTKAQREALEYLARQPQWGHYAGRHSFSAIAANSTCARQINDRLSVAAISGLCIEGAA